MPLSLCMIIKDEAFFLRDCLAAAAPYVDELVVVDTGSADGSRDIATTFTPRIFDYRWHDDYAAARNYSLAQAKHEWILVLDADELIAPGDFATLRQLIDTTELDGFFLQQWNYNNDQTAFGRRPTKVSAAVSLALPPIPSCVCFGIGPTSATREPSMKPSTSPSR
jgi:glycosyltransferase involved in cell wall biosynthesis